MTEQDDQEEQPEQEPGDPSDENLDRLEQRIRELKEPVKKDRTLAHGMVLAVSLGFVIVACLVGGYHLGNYLSQKYDSQLYLILSLLAGLAVAAAAAAKLMKPLMED
ncbi:MAG: AtpZ/AtpI family protein [Armatimonadetes bacterium]|nr:AtpZ/AtpI family protein [Armatimonadota bacterium]